MAGVNWTEEWTQEELTRGIKGRRQLKKKGRPPSACPHLEAEAAAVEAAFVHGGIFPDKTFTEATLVLEEQVSVAVVMQHALRQVEQGAQLAEGVGVGLHLASVVGHAEEDAAAVGSDVAPLLDDVEEAAAHHLRQQSGRALNTT